MAALLASSQLAASSRAEENAPLAKYEPMEALKDRDYGKPRMT
jgi:hypothetical protein